MGYQESWVIIRPQFKFNKLIQIYEKQRKAGFYDDIYSTTPKSIVILKQDIGKLAAGTKVLWVCGERCWHDEKHIFNDLVSIKLFCKIEIIPVENVFTSDIALSEGAGYDEIVNTIKQRSDLYTGGINFESDAAPSENAFIKRYTMEDYLLKIKSEKEKGR